MAKAIKTRVQNKHDVEANWSKATEFIPLAGELIIYEPDSNYTYLRFKIGDGKTVVGSLPFLHTVRTAGDITVDANSGTVSVKDDSHNHVISNVDGLQTKLNNVDASIASLEAHKHTVSHTPAGTVSKPTFTGSAVTSGTPSATATVASSTHTHKYTPAGTVSKPTFTGSAVTSGKPDTTNVTSIYSITGVGTLPSHSYTAPALTASVSNRCLTLSWSAGSHSFSAGSLPTRSSAISMPNTSHTHSVTAAGTVSQPTFTGTEASSTSISGTASVAKSDHTHGVTAAGTVSQPTFTGTAATLTTGTPT